MQVSNTTDTVSASLSDVYVWCGGVTLSARKVVLHARQFVHFTGTCYK